MSCENQTGTACSTCNDLGSTPVLPPSKEKSISSDMAGLVHVLARYQTWADFQAAFIEAVTPAYLAFKDAVSGLKKYHETPETREDFFAAREAYVQACYRFLGDPDLEHAKKTGNYERGIWDGIANQIPGINDITIGRKRARTPDDIFTICVYWNFPYRLQSMLFNNNGHIHTDVARALVEAHRQEQAALLSRAGGIPVPESLQPFARQLWQHHSLRDFRRAFEKKIVITHVSHNEAATLYRKSRSDSRLERLQKERAFLILQMRESLGYTQPPAENDSLGRQIWDACGRSVPHLDKKVNNRYVKLPLMDDIIDNLFSNLPERVRTSFFITDGDGKPVEIAPPSGTERLFVEHARQNGQDIPMPVLLRHPDLISIHGV